MNTWGPRVQSNFVHNIRPLCKDVLEAHKRFYTAPCAAPVGYSTLAGWWAHWDQYGETPSETVTRLKVYGGRVRRRNGKLTPAVLSYLEELMKSEPELYLDEIQQALSFRGWDLHETTIWRALTITLGWTLRLFTSAAAQRSAELREQYRNALSQFHDPKMFVFIDESSRGHNESRRRRSWAPRGKDNSLDEFFSSKERGYTLLAAADINGFVLSMCELVEMKHSHDDPDPTRGTIDTDRFLLYVDQFLCPNIGSAAKCEPCSVVVLDNATIHQDPRVRQKIEAAGGKVIYCAPYSPDLNPIEFAFHQYKAYLRRHTSRRDGVGNFGEIHVDACVVLCDPY
jgi:hypothetical protein